MASPLGVPAPAISTGGSNAFRCPGVLRPTSASFSVNNRIPPIRRTAAGASPSLGGCPYRLVPKSPLHPGDPVLLAIATSSQSVTPSTHFAQPLQRTHENLSLS